MNGTKNVGTYSPKLQAFNINFVKRTSKNFTRQGIATI